MTENDAARCCCDIHDDEPSWATCPWCPMHGDGNRSLTGELMAEQNARGFQPDPAPELAEQVRDALHRLSTLRAEYGPEMAAVMLVAGCTAEEIAECGGLP